MINLFVVCHVKQMKTTFVHLNMKTPEITRGIEKAKRDGRRDCNDKHLAISPNNLSLRAGLQTQDQNQKIRSRFISYLKSCHPKCEVSQDKPCTQPQRGNINIIMSMTQSEITQVRRHWDAAHTSKHPCTHGHEKHTHAICAK